MFGERNIYSIQWMALDAPIEVVKATYPALAKQHYPDGRGDGSEEGRIKLTETRGGARRTETHAWAANR